MMFAAIKKVKLELLFILFFVLTRIPDLGNDMFNTDVWKWKARSYDFGTGVFTWNLEKTIQKYHPGVTLMWLGTAAIKVYNLYSEYYPAKDVTEMTFQLHFVQKIFVVIAISISLAFSFYVLRKIFGARKAVIAMVLLSLEPFNIALTRVFHLEGLMSGFMLASYLWVFFYTLDHSKKERLAVSAVFAGLAVLTKTSALFMLPYVGLILLVETVSVKKSLKWFLSRMGTWVLLFAMTFILFWPAMWVFPGKALAAVYRGISDIGIEREHIQFYFGKLVEDPGPSYYFVVIALRSSVLLVVGIIGLAFFGKKVFPMERRRFFIYSFLFVVFYFVQLTIPAKKLDRYILPDILVLSLLTSFFWIWVFEKIKGTGLVKFAPLVIAAVIPSLYLHPDYFSYYNPIFGGLKKGIEVIEPKWMIGTREVVRYFDERGFKRTFGDISFEELASTYQINNALTVGFQEKYYTQIFPFFRRIGGYAVIEDLTPFAVKTRFFVYPVWDDISSHETRFSLEYVGTIDVRGVEVYRVYERK